MRVESPEHLHRAFQDAFNRHDLESIVALYETDAVLATANGPLTGIDAIRDRYRIALAGRWLFVIDNPSVPQD
jgi:ketosteroid isomerase-like protein